MAAPRRQQSYTVSFRQKWSDAWEVQPQIFCESFTQVAGPDVAEAVLSYNYGKVGDVGAYQLGDRGQAGLNGWYVKIILNQFTEFDEETVRKWYGIVVETTDERKGTLDGVLTGKQTFHCRGLEFALQRKEIDSSFVGDSSGSEIEIGRAIAFNLGRGRDTDHERHGNKSDTPGERDAPIFAYDIGVGGVHTETATRLWSVQDIILYLFHYHPPADVDGADQLNWTISDGEDAKILEQIYPATPAQGKSIFQLLNELIDRRRLVGWCIDVVGDDEHPKLNTFTFTAEAIDLPSGTMIPANGSLQTWYFDDDRKIQTAIVSEDDATRFDVVIVKGASLTGTCSIGDSRSGSLVKDWDATSQTAYNTGASAAGSYAGLINIDKQSANQAFRSDEKLFAKVFRAFLLKPAWDGLVNGLTVCPDPTKEGGDGTPSTESTKFWYPGLRFLDWLPLRTDYDYTDVADFETTSLTIDSSQPNYLHPFAVTQIGTLYYRLDRPVQGKLAIELLKNIGRDWAASLRMQDDCPGLLIDVQGASQHMIAKVEFDPVDTDDENDEIAQVDWKEILCTVCIEFDQQVEVTWPEGGADTDADFVRELIIDLPSMRLDYLANDTVIGVDNAGALVISSGGYVRDDRRFMQDVARCAYAWYGHTRKALTVVQHDLVCPFNIGDLITEIGSAASPITVNSVVTKLAFDLKAGTVTVFIQYAELDPVRS